MAESESYSQWCEDHERDTANQIDSDYREISNRYRQLLELVCHAEVEERNRYRKTRQRGADHAAMRRVVDEATRLLTEVER
jgi:hypothetical protein